MCVCGEKKRTLNPSSHNLLLHLRLVLAMYPARETFLHIRIHVHFENTNKFRRRKETSGSRILVTDMYGYVCTGPSRLPYKYTNDGPCIAFFPLHSLPSFLLLIPIQTRTTKLFLTHKQTPISNSNPPL